MEPLDIEGPEGRLEAEFVAVENPRGIAILCHPHPLYGGNMHDAVLGKLETVLNHKNWSTLRFNFRGVGHSDGSYDGGLGEVDDLLAAHRWAVNRCAVDRILLAGYSFGAIVTINAAARIVPSSELDKLILVAPPLALLEKPVKPEKFQVKIFAGTEDQWVSVSDCQTWLEDSGNLEIIEGADHFFGGMLSQLGEAVARNLS